MIGAGGVARLTPGPCVMCDAPAAREEPELHRLEALHTVATRAVRDYKRENLVLRQPSCRRAVSAAPFACMTLFNSPQVKAGPANRLGLLRC